MAPFAGGAADFGLNALAEGHATGVARALLAAAGTLVAVPAGTWLLARLAGMARADKCDAIEAALAGAGFGFLQR